MNAKEISDATLPTVTPDDDDLMILYDVSEETTGKAPISKIANFITSISNKKDVIQSQTTETEVNFTDSYVVSESGGYIITLHIANISGIVSTNSLRVNIENSNLMKISNTSAGGWADVYDSIYIPLKKGVTLNFIGNFSTGGFRYSYSVKKTS